MAINDKIKNQLEEYVKCKDSVFYFAETHVVLEQSGEDVTPKLYDPQKEFLNSLLFDHYVALLKTRQTGGSVSAQIFCAWAMVFYKNVIVCVVSRKGDESTDFAKKVMIIIDHLPKWMQPKFEIRNVRSCRLDNGSELHAESISPANPGSLFRGKAVTIAVVDEAAHIKYIEEAYPSFSPTMFKAHKVAKENGIPFALMVISTPNKTVGIGKWFFDIWKSTFEGDALFTRRKLFWKDIPDFRDDPEWYKTQCKLLGNNAGKIKQELEMEFLGSDDTWLPFDTISQLNKSHRPPTNIIPYQGGMLWMWDLPVFQKFYLIGVDTASAYGGDKSAVQIFDYENFVQVAEFRGKLKVTDFCENVIGSIIAMFPNSLVVVEDNSYGNQVVETLERTTVNTNLYIQKSNWGKQPVRYGLNTNNKTRPLMMEALFSYITEDPEMIRSERLVLELNGLIEKASSTYTKVEADKGMNDDLCLALAFLCYVRKYDPPLHILTESTKNTFEDIMETVMTNEYNRYIPQRADVGNKITPYTDVGNLERLNKVVLQDIKEKLGEFQQTTGGHVNVMDILGYNR